MKKSIKVNGKTMGTFKVRDFEHFQSQLRYKHKVVSNKKIYSRKGVKAYEI